MILEIKQTSSVGQNRFNIMSNGQIIYQADSSWMPLVSNESRKMHITNASGAVVYQTYYSLLDNLAESMIPMKYLFTGSQRFVKFDIVDYTNNYVGSFYAESNGIAESKVCLEYRGQMLVGYRRKLGVKEYVSFYAGETQVGQLTKSNKVVDNLDAYLLHFVNGFEEWTPILAFFTIIIRKFPF